MLKKTMLATVRLNEKEKKTLERIAIREDRSLSGVLRQAVKVYLKKGIGSLA